MARKPKSIDPVGSPQGDVALASAAFVGASTHGFVGLGGASAGTVNAKPGDAAAIYSRSGDLRSVAIDCTQADIEATAAALRHFIAGILRDRHRNHGDGALGMALVSLDALARIVPTREEPQA